MHKFETLQQAENYLLGYSPLKPDGETYTLGRMRQLMVKLGNPQDELKVIHIAGTSGKTSTAYFIRALLEEAGQKTGLTVSPHITSITERVQVGGRPLPDEIFIGYLQEFLSLLDRWPRLKPTYFELLIAFACWVFQQEKVDYAVVETGLGGLLDATNVVTRPDKVCVLTPIGIDHTQVLGETVEAIAQQKAGIIWPQNSVFSVKQSSKVTAIFQQVSHRKGASLEFVKVAVRSQPANLPHFQHQNWQLARRAVEYVMRRDRLASFSPDQLSRAAQSTPPGRFEEYKIGNTTVILDGAHNPQKLEALIGSLPDRARRAVWLAAITEAPEQKITDCLTVIAGATRDVIWTDFMVGQDIKARRSVDSLWLVEKARRYGIHSDAESNPETALRRRLSEAPDYLIIAGSLFLVARLRPALERLARRQSYQPPAK